MRKPAILFLLLIILVSLFAFSSFSRSASQILTDEPQGNLDGIVEMGGPKGGLHPLSIEALRKGEYPGSEIVIEQALEPGSNYKRYIASYKSEGLKIYGLLTVPNGNPPPTGPASTRGESTRGGWPAIIFNHGYIPPSEYQSTERYIAHTDGFSRNGYVLFRPDYRGHGNSEGEPSGAYGSNGYTIDVLNAVASIKKLKDPSSQPIPRGPLAQIVDPSRIGMWGHSLGGHITLRNMVVSRDIRAGVIWAGVVASYPDLLNNWRRRSASPPPGIPTGARRWREVLTQTFGTPEQNPTFWNSISATSFLSDISGPLQLHHGTADSSVPVEFSEKLAEQMKALGKAVELYTYPGDDHNITSNFDTALQRSIEFFDKYLK